MKTQFASVAYLLIATALLAFGADSSLQAQLITNSSVTIVASDPQASEAGPDKGVFTVRRSGSTDNHVIVFFTLTGTAMNGADYEGVANSVVIPPGAREANITVLPIDDTEIENNETVIARLAPSPLASPMEQYIIGTISNAVITIYDNDRPTETNKPPTVQIVSPGNESVLPIGEDIQIAAHASDLDGYVATVEFFEGTNSLGIATNNPLAMSPINPFQLTWSKAPAGSYVLRAKATDDDGATALSAPVRVTVEDRFVPTIVNIYATDPQATEIPEVPPGQERPQLFDPAVFTITRSGNTNIDLVVRYRIGGGASNGVDYARIPGEVTIPAGSISSRIEIAPIDDLLPEGTETVTIGIEIPVCIAILPPPPECYQVGSSGLATAFIHDDDPKETNYPPSVRITSPANGAKFPEGTDITIRAVTVDPDGYANTVEFFAGANKIGEASVIFIQEPTPGQPIDFEFSWQNAPAGSHALTARTIDNQGNRGVSAPVWIAVGETNRPPPTNTLPVVSIVARDSLASEGTNAGSGGTAMFLVSRSGPTNANLIVTYTISGTASNGVDYLTLPHSVLIPAGHRSASIIVTPIDDLLVEKAETVVLSLAWVGPVPSPTYPPTFFTGIPAKAAVMIVDNDWVRPPVICLPDRLFHLCSPGTNGHCYRIEASTNMNQWVPICTNLVTDGAVHFIDPDAPEFPNRFYRVIPEPILSTEE